MKLVQVRRFAAACASFFLLAAPTYAVTRPLPDDVNVKVFAKSEQGHLNLLVRLPLAAVKDIQFPVRGEANYLDLTSLQSMLPGAAQYWIAPDFDVAENGIALTPEITATRISALSDRSFDSYPDALAHLTAPDFPAGTDTFWDQVSLDIHFQYPLHSTHSLITIRPRLASLGLRVSTDMQYVEPDGTARNFSFQGDPGLIYLGARWSNAAKQFLVTGFHYVVSTTDFVLFLFCLALPLRRYREILPAVVAFAAALSLTLLASAFGFSLDPIWFHPLIETLTALAILIAAFANIAGPATPRRRALFALTAGAVFGFSSAFDLASKIQFAASHTLTAALAFNIGVLLAIAIAIAVLIPTLSFLFSFARTERIELIVISALIADTAWGWLADRWTHLIKVPIHAPIFNAALLAITLRCLMILVLFGGLAWLADGWLKSRKDEAA